MKAESDDLNVRSGLSERSAARVGIWLDAGVRGYFEGGNGYGDG